MTSRTPAQDENPTLQRVLTALTDEDCRRILRTVTEPMSAREIGEVCDIPLSTAYRKLHMLSEASLVAERVDVTSPGKHTTKYVTDFDTISVRLTEGGEFEVSVGTDVADGSSASLRWERIGQES
ncbi:MAG: helix-turn-helix domain-containing protein [Halanaeroarchaeum sp.]